MMLIAVLLLLIITGAAYFVYQKRTEAVTKLFLFIYSIYALILGGLFLSVIIGGFITGDLWLMTLSAVILFVVVIGLLVMRPDQEVKKRLREANERAR